MCTKRQSPGPSLNVASRVALQDIGEALKRIPQEEVDARNQRLKRASDISLKKEYLAPHLQAQQTPYLSYVQVGCCSHAANNLEADSLDMRRPLCDVASAKWFRYQLSCCTTLQDALDQVQAENAEKALLGTGAPYQRTIP